MMFHTVSQRRYNCNQYAETVKPGVRRRTYEKLARRVVRSVRSDAHRRLFQRYAHWLNANDHDEQQIFAALSREKGRMRSPVGWLDLRKIARTAAKASPLGKTAQRLRRKPWRTPSEVEVVRERVEEARRLLAAPIWHGTFGRHCQLVSAMMLNEMLRTCKKTVSLRSC